MRRRINAPALAGSLLLLPAAAGATWPNDGTPLSLASGNQLAPVAAQDGSGGAIVAWSDTRNGAEDVYVNRVNADGTTPWPTTDGVAVCTASFDQTSVSIAADGAGGAFVAWRDRRSGAGFDIYAQRVSAGGLPLWTGDGVPVCTIANNQYAPVLVADGAGGVIIVWYDYRAANYDIYAQRLDANGAAQWAAGGVGICSAIGNQNSPVIVPDDVGGAIIVWPDYRDGNGDIYAQRVDDLGVAQWAGNGVPLCVNIYNQIDPVMVSDELHGAIVAWRDHRSGSADVYAQRVNATGTAAWTADGVAVCTAALDQVNPVATGDGAGGAIVGWQDSRGGIADVYAQRVNSAGASQWTPNGVAVCTAASTQTEPVIVSDDAGGALLAWSDARGGNTDVYSQRVNAAGVGVWTMDGLSMCGASGDQSVPAAVGDALGGIIATWQDARAATADVYAIRRTASGDVPTATRSVATPAFLVRAAYPNPFASTAQIDVVLGSSAEVVLDLFDVAGRRVQTTRYGTHGAGTHRFVVSSRDDAGRNLPGGIYFCRITATGAAQTQRLVLIR